MKSCQKSILSVKSALIIIVSLFGLFARASEGSLSKHLLFHETEKMSSTYNSWCRQILHRVWDKSFIDVERRQKFTAENIRLANLKWDRNEAMGGVTFLSLDTVEVPCQGPLWLTKLLDCIDGRFTQALVHEYVHFAQHGAKVALDNEALEKIEACFKRNEPCQFFAEPTKATDRKIDAKEDHFNTHREFFCELKSLDLLEQKNPAAYQALMGSWCRSYLSGNLDRNKQYPNCYELLVMRTLYKNIKKNLYGDPKDVKLHEFIDKWLKNRDLYKKAMTSVNFLSEFKKNQTTVSLRAKIVFGGLLLSPLALSVGVLCAKSFLNLGSNKDGLSLFSLAYGAVSLARLLSLPSVGKRLLDYNPFWDKERFKQALDVDALRVERTVQSEVFKSNINSLELE